MLKDIIKTNILKGKAERQAGQATTKQRAEQQAFVNKLLAERQGIKNGE